MKRILDDMGIKDPSTAVMVGDNIRADGTAAIALGMNYAWQKGGTEIDDVTLRCYKTFCQNPEYKLTTADHLAQMNDTNRPTEVLESFTDLNKHYRFTARENVRNAEAKIINGAVMKRITAGKSR